MRLPDLTILLYRHILRMIPIITYLERSHRNKQQVQEEPAARANPRAAAEYRTTSHGGLGLRAAEGGVPELKHGYGVPQPQYPH